MRWDLHYNDWQCDWLHLTHSVRLSMSTVTARQTCSDWASQTCSCTYRRRCMPFITVTAIQTHLMRHNYQSSADTHTHTHTHARTHLLCFHVLWGHSIGVMVFILYNLYVLLPYTYPTPKLSPHRKHSAFLDFQKNLCCMIYKLVSSWGPKNVPTR